MRAALGTIWRRAAPTFRQNSEASILPTFALALVPLIGLVGAAVDYSRANSIRTGLQMALDSAILAGARDGTSNWSSVALDVFKSNFTSPGVTATPTFVKNTDASYSGSAGTSVAATFLNVMGVSTIPVSVENKALAPGEPGQLCVVSLNKNATPAVQLTGNASVHIKAPQCVFHANSTSNNAVVLNGNTSITSAHNCIVGSVSKVGNAQITPAPDAMCKPVPDPFAKWPKPAIGSCDYTDYKESGSKSVTLQPGVYCGGMAFSGQLSVTFAPGIYVIKDGMLKASGGSSFTGEGVSFFLIGAGAGLDISGGANWHITATKTGLLAGFVFFLDPSGSSGIAATGSKLAGTAEMYFEGVVYLPQQQLVVTGGSEAFTPSPYTAYIADKLDFQGNGKLVINNDMTKTSVPIPDVLKVTLNGRPRLTR
jgi:Flp pilus assembly protein TadG